MTSFKADLIGVFDQVNGKTGIPFKSCSFNVGAGRIATTGANDKRDKDGNITNDIASQVQSAFEEAKSRGMGLVFEVTNATLIPEIEELDDGIKRHLVINGTQYFKIASAEVGTRVKFTKVGEIERGGVAEFVL